MNKTSRNTVKEDLHHGTLNIQKPWAPQPMLHVSLEGAGDTFLWPYFLLLEVKAGRHFFPESFSKGFSAEEVLVKIVLIVDEWMGVVVA